MKWLKHLKTHPPWSLSFLHEPPGILPADLNRSLETSTFYSPLVQTNLTNQSFNLPQTTILFCFSLFLVCSRTDYPRYSNDCMIAFAAQLWNQGDPWVLDATVLSLTTNESCASLTVLIGIFRAVTELAWHECHPHNPVLTNSLGWFAHANTTSWKRPLIKLMANSLFRVCLDKICTDVVLFKKKSTVCFLFVLFFFFRKCFDL